MIERYPGAEAADPYQYVVVMERMRAMLMEKGVRSGQQPADFMGDGTAKYEVADDVSFSDEVETYELSLRGEELEQLHDKTRQALTIGDELHLTYVPMHYLVSRQTGRQDLYPEHFQAQIKAEAGMPYSELTLSVMTEDYDTGRVSGYRHIVPRKPYLEEPPITDEILVDRLERVVYESLARLSKPSAEECRALIDVAHTLARS